MLPEADQGVLVGAAGRIGPRFCSDKQRPEMGKLRTACHADIYIRYAISKDVCDFFDLDVWISLLQMIHDVAHI